MRTIIPGSVCVAVVDDDENLRRSFARLLRAAGIHSIAYASAEAFLEDTARPQFDCLVLDIELPGLSGLELQERLSDSGISVPVLFITAYDEPRSRERAYAAGCAGYFRKTDSGRDVLDAICEVVNARS